jgi:hypothetical protein
MFIRRLMLWVLCIPTLCWGQAPAIDQEAIAAAVNNLGAADFEARQAATDVLWRAGAAAEEALKNAAKSSDPEVRTRANALLTRLRLGIRPDTPPDVAALIDQFRFGASAQLKRQALVELQAKGHWRAILTLLRGERDVATRKALATAIAAEASKLIRPLVERGELDEAEEVLELVALSEAGIAQLTLFLIETGRLEAAVAKARRTASTEGGDENWSRLAYLLRASGDMPGAVEAAEQTSDLFLKANFNAEAERWDAAGKIAAELFKQYPTRLETAAFAATFHRLAGNQAEYQGTLDALMKVANIERVKRNEPLNNPQDPFDANPSRVGLTYVWVAAETLLVNGRVNEAIEILKRTNPKFAHALLWRQHRHRAALEFVGIEPQTELNRAWLDKLPALPGDATAQQEPRFSLAGQVARELRELGRKEQLEQLVTMLREFAKPTNDRGRRLAALALLEWQLGRYDDVPRDALTAIAAGYPRPAVFSSLLKQHGSLAETWFDLWTSMDPVADREKLFAQAVWLVAAQPPAGRLPEDWRQLVTSAGESLGNLPPPDRLRRLLLLAQTSEIRGDRELARKYYGQASEVDAATATRLGDLAVRDKDWQAAAEAYARAAKGTASEAIATFLQGYCLAQLDQDAKGRELMRAGRLAALAPEMRMALVAGLQERGLKDAAVEQLQLVRRTALPDSGPAASAAQQHGNLISAATPGEAAAAWRHLQLHVLNATTNYSEVEGYLLLGHMIHKVRAAAAVAAKDRARIEEELAACENLVPGDVQATVELAPKLNQAGFAELADELLARGMRTHEAVMEAFPESATYFNNAAWMCARAQRKLDRALELAQRAIELMPQEASYQDTLAEVHFQRGDRGQAVAAARQAVEFAPHSALFAKRLKHFEEDEVKSLDMPE